MPFKCLNSATLKLGGVLHFLYQFNGKRNDCSTEQLQNLQFALSVSLHYLIKAKNTWNATWSQLSQYFITQQHE